MSTKKSLSRDTLQTLEKISKKKLTLGNLLWSIRKGEEMSQVDFAEKLDISKQFLCDIERGRRLVSPKTAAQYAEKLGYSVDQFVRLCLQDLLIRDGISLQVNVSSLRTKSSTSERSQVGDHGTT